MNMMGLLWMGLGVVVIGLAIALLFFRGASTSDLGSVSREWIAEHHRESD
jgi:hypothetical protein